MHSDGGHDVRIASIGWRPLVLVLLGVAGLLLAMSVARQLAELLQLLLVATFLAIAADAAARSVQRHGVSRAWSLVAVIGGTILGGLLAVVLLLPPLLRQGADLLASAPDMAQAAEGSAAWQHMSDTFSLDNTIIDVVKDVLVQIPEALLELAVDLIGGVFGLVTLVIAVAFLLAGGGTAIRLLLRIAPPLATARGWTIVIGAYTNIGRYVVGATTQAILAGVGLTLVLLLLDVPYALSLGVFMFIMDYIPLVGATIGSIPAVAVALFTGGWFDGIAVLLFLVVYQQVENSIIQPRIQGRVVQLPGIAIFFSVMVGSELMGVLGALIAVPIASIVQIILQQYFEYVGRPQVELPHAFEGADP